VHWVYYFGRFLIRFLVFFFAFWKTKGRENVPKEGPFLIVSNHIFIADPPMLASSIPRRCFFMAKEDLWHNAWSRYWVENFGAFPVRRDSFDRDAIRRAEEKLKQGFGVIMFPEGGRSKNAQLKTALPGAALIAARMNVPILPVGITGSEKLKNLWWSFWHHPTATITIGKPFDLPLADESKPTREQRREMIDYIMGKIAELLPPEYQGVYAAE
jgi:1-acyl-sn-glycerol-3-phosphate acyltransferase